MAKKNYIAIVRDHSGSMYNISNAAARDYNDNIAALKEASSTEGQDTIVSTIMCGVGPAGKVQQDVVNSSVQGLREIELGKYIADGGSTPLFDSVGEAIDILERVPDRDDPEVSFLVMVITDGYENSSRRWTGKTIGERMRALQATDRWTFAFRAPRGSKHSLELTGVPSGNILEWEQTEKGFQQATQVTRMSVQKFYTDRTAGMKATRSFYTNLTDVTTGDLKAELKDISREVQILTNSSKTVEIRPFVEGKLKAPLLKGAAFYELTKTEPKVQDYKLIAIRDRDSGAIYAGAAARQMLGLPDTGTVRITPGNHSKFDVFIQSTSVNRKLYPGNKVLYWEKNGVPFTEGPSSYASLPKATLGRRAHRKGKK